MIIKFQFSHLTNTLRAINISSQLFFSKIYIFVALCLLHILWNMVNIRMELPLCYIVFLLNKVGKHSQFITSAMSTAAEQEESLEFYKIQVMEKDRQIADFTAKMKKVEFKHNRQIKEAKIAKDRSDALLKDEKAKSDKYSKLAQENAQQNQVLEMRLAQLKRDKERELADIHAKYNTLKEEVRSYERILPTFTFLTEVELTINELPNYEDLFVNLREKTSQCQQQQLTYKQAEIEWEETVRSLKANEDVLKAKKNEAEKNMKEVLSKLIEHEHQISDLKSYNQELLENAAQIQQQLELTRERCESLEESIKDYECKIQRLAEDFEAELANKEEEVYRAQQGEIVQLEEELQSQQAQFERKEAVFNEQISIMEDEINYLTNKYQAEIETFQEHYLCIKEETDRMRNEIVNEKRRYDELQQRFSESTNNLIRISSVNEQTEQKNRTLELKVTAYEHKMIKESKLNEAFENSRFQQLQREYESALERLNLVSQHYSKLQEERDHFQEENFLLREELSSKQLEHNQSKSFFLQLPKQNSFDERNRKRSSEIESTFMQRYIEQVKETRSNYEDTGKIRQLQRQLALLQKNREIQLQKYYQTDSKAKQLQSENTKFHAENEGLRRQRQKYLNESITLKEKLIHLTRLTNEHEKAAYGNSTKSKLEKTKIESLEEEIKHLVEDNKREKESIKKLKQQIKTIKQANVLQNDKLNKQVKELFTQLQTVKTEKEKMRQQLVGKEKIWAHDAALLKSSKNLEEILKDQIRQAKLQREELELSYLELQNKLVKANDEVIYFRKEVEKFETQLKQSMRETELANESLYRQRKQRSLLTVPSLHSIGGEQAQEETFNQIYAKIPQKQGEINILQRQILDLKEELETLKLTQHAKIEIMQSQNNEYVQTIIEMKMRCAQSEMRASEKEYLYSQLKKKAAALNIILK